MQTDDHQEDDIEIELDDVTGGGVTTNETGPDAKTKPDGLKAETKTDGPPPLLRASSLLEDFMADFDLRHHNHKENRWNGGIRVGVKMIDEKLMGFRKGSLNLVSAAPNVGKTTLVNNMAFDAAVHPEQDVGVLYATFEDHPVVFVRKLVSRLSGHSIRDLESGEIPPTDAKVKEAIMTLASASLYYLYGNPQTTPEILIERIREVQEETGAEGTLLIVDYLQYYARFFKGTTEMDRIAALLPKLKHITETTETALLMIGSQNRETNKAGGASMFGGRGSGDIEYDADTIIVLTKDDEEKTDEEGMEFRTIEAVKTRFGGAGSRSKLLFTMSHAKFSEYSDW